MTARVGIYLYREDDGTSPAQRLRHAVRRFCASLEREMPPEDRLEIARTEAGKPYFPHAPQIRFSVSHSGVWWACALAENEIGLDLQEYTLHRGETENDAAARHRKLSRRFLHPREADFIEGESIHRFYAVWTAREAYVKYLGTGIDKYFSEYCVVPDDVQSLRAMAEPKGDAYWRAMGVCYAKTALDGYAVCICTENEAEWSMEICSPDTM